jgi:hypothetical protein
MPLGDQFKNTYWFDDQGAQHAAIEEGQSPRFISGADVDSHEGPLQGLLFNPYTGTGLKQDPQVAPETRRAAVNKALGFDVPMLEYQKRVGRQLPVNKRKVVQDRDAEGNPRVNPRTGTQISTSIPKTSEKALKGHQDLVADALHESAYPLNELEQTKAKATVHLGKHKASYAYSDNSITLNIAPGRKQISTEERTVATGPDLENPHPNKGFWSHYNKSVDPYGMAYDVLDEASHWVNPSTNHVMTKKEAHEQFYSGDSEGTLDELKASGYYPNVHFGKPNKEKYAPGKEFYISQLYERGDGNRVAHLGFKPEAMETRKVNVVKREKPKASASTIVHEIGHTRDSNSSQPVSKMHIGAYADPMNEGIADAFSDRYTKDRYQSSFEDSAVRRLEIERSGYGSKSRYWENNVERALYSATRFHTALGAGNYKEIPDRRSFVDPMTLNQRTTRSTVTQANKLALGHMVHHMPHVKEHLKNMGYENEGARSHQEYLRWASPKFKDPEPEWHQPTLPGFDKE